MKKPKGLALYGGAWKLKMTKDDMICCQTEADVHFGADKARKISAWFSRCADYMERTEQK
jgi:hypothetical protein